MTQLLTSPEGLTQAQRLALPFDPADVKFKPQAVKGNRALAIAYADVRAVMDRLDDVVGSENWQDDYEVLPDTSVVCRLRVRLDGRWVRKTDVGSPSEQPDGGDRLKAAFSDALKRAAVKFGIGRYLYRLPQQWADFDPVKKQFIQPPKLPTWASPTAIARPAKPAGKDKPAEPVGPKPSVNEGKAGLPASGAEFHRRLREADSDLAAKGLCPVGALLAHVAQVGVKAGYGADLNQWTGPAIQLAADETRSFKSRLAAATESKSAA